MTYRGVMNNGVVILEGEKPSDGTVVEVMPLPQSTGGADDLASDPAIGMWKNRDDLPDDSIQASKILSND
jgi:hypothetical protein